MKKFAFFLMLTPLTLFARFSAKDALMTAPAAAIGYINKTERLDMADYLDAGLTDHSVRNRRNGQSRLTELTDSTFVIENGEVQTITARLLAGKSDTLIAIIETLKTPAKDSKLTVYNKAWQPVSKAWREPTTKDWGKFSAKFLLTEYTLKGDTLTLTDRTAEWETEGAPKVKELKFRWDQKSEKFKRLR